ncbi:C-X-C chemokine receptor type 2-like [Mobula birostris]|uniref:C-X-C chemokine receptor type 2-like n=1 Tax=Mobula birostris TaxID=1983395 RepID=UPI003B28D68A
MAAIKIKIDDINIHDLFGNSTIPQYYSHDPRVSPCPQVIISSSVNVVLAIVYSLACFLAVMGNLVVMIVILHNRRSTSSTDIYLLHLATADLLFAVSLPFWAVDAMSGWVFGDAMCKIVSMLQEVNFYSGILFLACISVDRYLAIVHSAQPHWQKRPFLIKLVCAVVWVLAVLLSLPILYKGKFAYDGRVLCYELLEGESIATWKNTTRFLRHVIGFLIPLGVMVFCYSVTIHRLCQTKGFQKQKAMKVIIAVVLAFLICWLPHNITVFVDTLLRGKLITDSCDRRKHITIALNVTQCLGSLHSCVNPILYGFIGIKFRRNLVRLLANKGLVSSSYETQFQRTVQSSVTGTTSVTI